MEFTEAAVEFVAEEGFDPEFGARPLRRTIQRRVDNELSRMVLEGSLNPGEKVVVDLVEGKLTLGVLDETSPTETASQNVTGEEGRLYAGPPGDHLQQYERVDYTWTVLATQVPGSKRCWVV